MTNWSKWEYWPVYMFYVPLLPYYIYLAIRSRKFTFFTAANPGIVGGGSGFDSKYKTIMLVPEKWRPKTIFVNVETSVDEILSLLDIHELSFPLILKPDIGFRGLKVAKINKEEELRAYLASNDMNIIIQSFAPGILEYGVFYHRIPGKKHGRITSLTQKSYLQVVGDEVSSVLELMKKSGMEPAFVKMVTHKRGADFIVQVPSEGEVVILSYIGSHSKGSTFVSINDKITVDLERRIDELCDHIEGWNYGRLDLKVESMEALLKGESIKILEINGVIGEPIHIYDSVIMTYPKALKEIKEHWKIIYKLARINRENGAECYPLGKFLKNSFSLIKYKSHLERLEGL